MVAMMEVGVGMGVMMAVANASSVLYIFEVPGLHFDAGIGSPCLKVMNCSSFRVICDSPWNKFVFEFMLRNPAFVMIS